MPVGGAQPAPSLQTDGFDPLGGILSGDPPPLLQAGGVPLPLPIGSQGHLRGGGSGGASPPDMLKPLEGLIDGLEHNMSAGNPKKDGGLLRSGLFKPLEGMLERLKKNGAAGSMNHSELQTMQNTEEQI